MEFRILGPVECADGGRAVELGGLRERTLLASLLLAANRVVSADRLAEELWSGDPPPHSMATLRVYISRLRRALGTAAGALVTQPPGYRLAVGRDALDAYRFENLTEAARAELAAGNAAGAAVTLRRALGLWRGPALADVADQPFAQADAARLEEARLAALEDRVEADLACGRHASLIGELDALVANNPLRERLCGQRMTALYRCGRQADALHAYTELRTRLAEDLGIDPSPELRRLHQAVLRQDHALAWRGAGEPAGVAATGGPAVPGARSAEGPATAAGARPGSVLPSETTSFVGREAELAKIADMLGLARLVSLTGPGGSGKSRLALRAGAQLSARYPGGAWLVELSPVVAGELVVSALAAALWAREEPGQTLLDGVLAVLRDRDALLIIDNCEHVLDAAAQLAVALLRACPRLRIIATSQSRLGVSGEATWPVPPLAVPGPGNLDLAALAQVESVRLFCDRAALARPGFSLTGGNAEAVADICRRLDGLPLAIELAAARIAALAPAQLAARLSDRFTLLTSGSRAGLPRHRTLAAAIEWSHDLLTQAEQVCLRRLAVFAGGCTLDAAEVVCPGEGLPGDAVFEAIAALVDRSLLTTEERSGSMRYRMLESIQVYARERLEAAGETADMTGRHLAWLLDYARRADLEGPDQSAWLDLLDADHDNFQAGLERSLAGGDTGAALALAGALAPFWAIRGQIQEGRRWLDAALSQAGAASEDVAGASEDAVGAAGAAGDAIGAGDARRRALAVAMAGAAQLASVHADTGAQLRYLERSLELWRGLGNPAGLARCLADLGSAAHVRGDYAGALARYTEALELARLSADSRLVARSLSGLGRLALHQGDHARAVACYSESLDRFQQAGDVRQATLVLGNLGVISYLQGDLERARARLEGHLGNARRLGDRKLIGGALTNLGMVDYDAGDLDRAAAAQQEALGLAEQIGDRRLAAVALTNLGLVALARRDHAGARSCHLRSLELAEAVGERRGIAESLEELAKVESAEGAADRAAVLFGAAQALRETIGSPATGPDLTRLNRAVTAVAAVLGTGFGALQAAGRSLSMEDAIRFARGRAAPRQPTTEPAAPL